MKIETGTCQIQVSDSASTDLYVQASVNCAVRNVLSTNRLEFDVDHVAQSYSFRH